MENLQLQQFKIHYKSIKIIFYGTHSKKIIRFKLTVNWNFNHSDKPRVIVVHGSNHTYKPSWYIYLWLGYRYIYLI